MIWGDGCKVEDLYMIKGHFYVTPNIWIAVHLIIITIVYSIIYYLELLYTCAEAVDTTWAGSKVSQL